MAYINFRFPEGTWFEANHPVAFDPELGWVPKRDVQANLLGTTVAILDDGVRSNGQGEVRDATDHAILAVGDS
jgi:hypothetical protein